MLKYHLVTLCNNELLIKVTKLFPETFTIANFPKTFTIYDVIIMYIHSYIDAIEVMHGLKINTIFFSKMLNSE